MKQNITTKQLNELSLKGKKSLEKWYREVKGVDYINSQEILVGDIFLPLLSIGHLIEFLYKNVNDRISVGISKKNGSYISKDNFMMSSDIKDELVDSLWESVKEVLNES